MTTSKTESYSTNSTFGSIRHHQMQNQSSKESSDCTIASTDTNRPAVNSQPKIRSGARYEFNNVIAIALVTGSAEIEWREYRRSNKIRKTPRWYFEKYARQQASA